MQNPGLYCINITSVVLVYFATLTDLGNPQKIFSGLIGSDILRSKSSCLIGSSILQNFKTNDVHSIYKRGKTREERISRGYESTIQDMM